MQIKGYELDSELTTLISVPERGPFGKSSYRGNYSGHVLIKLIQYLQRIGIKRPYVYDPMEGGQTSRDVCNMLELPYIGADIHQGFDVVNDDFHDFGFDLTVLHYPYWKMIDYAENLPAHLQEKDMSRMSWNTFIDAVSHVNMKAAAHSEYIAVLVGDMAIKGGIKSIQREMTWPGMCIRHLTKIQHQAMSIRKQYRGNFIPIVTEHLILLQSQVSNGFMVVLMMGGYKKVDADSYVTWKTAVKKVARDQEIITPDSIFQGVKKSFPVKFKKTNTPEATIRRTLQELEADGFLTRVQRGSYRVA
ncbi:hypothetical protein D3C74_91390 [compost metagenome]